MRPVALDGLYQFGLFCDVLRKQRKHALVVFTGLAGLTDFHGLRHALRLAHFRKQCRRAVHRAQGFADDGRVDRNGSVLGGVEPIVA